MDQKNIKPAKPFLKWAGGKRQLLKEIEKYYPFDDNYTKYAEPFVGGGAVLFDILNKYNLKEVYISDTNHALINLYRIIRDEIDDLILILQSYHDDFRSMIPDDRKSFYYTQRSLFNELKSDKRMVFPKATVDPLITAALMIFLNKTCFNGLYCVNKQGHFNTPIGSYENPAICDEDNLRAVFEKLQNVKIVYGDYTKSKEFIDEHTFVYFDPPYRPLTNTASFTSYMSNTFDDECQRRLADYIAQIHHKGAKILLSNSDPKNSNPNDEFFDDSVKACTAAFSSRTK